MQIYKFNSILKPVLWGGDKLVAFKQLPACDEPIGESWELSAMPGFESVVAEGPDQGLTLSQLVQRYGADLVGEDVYHRYGDRFPLLIKFIDAKRDLSIQVHPDDELALRRHGCAGKNEMWYILEADEGALIHTGFNRQMSDEELDRRLAEGSILEVINADEAKTGDAFFIPAGQIHSIGAGSLLVEIQQSCDITYRVWDYGRRDANGNLRQLHVQQAHEALDFNVRDGKVDYAPCDGQGETLLLQCDDFAVSRVVIDDCYVMEMPRPHSFVAMVCIHGDVTIAVEGMDCVTMHQGETVLVPATVNRLQMTGNAQLLLATVPGKLQ